MSNKDRHRNTTVLNEFINPINNHNKYNLNPRSKSATLTGASSRMSSPLTNNLIIFIMIFLIAAARLGCLCAKTRLRNTLDVKFNLDCHLPQCNSSDPDKPAVNLFQVISSNPESPDKTNFIWSNIGGPPMVITTSSSQESSLDIDWEVLLNVKKSFSNGTSGFHFNVTQDASIGLLVEKIILFDDIDKSGLFTPQKPRIEIDWADIIWDLASRATYHKDDFLKTHLRMRPKHQYLNGNILIKLAIPRDYKADRQKELPHLKLNNQSISMVIIVDGIQPPSNFTNTRLAMTFVVVVQSPAGEVSLDTDSESLISDDFTPGVFRIKSLEFRTKQELPPNTQSTDDNLPDIYAESNGDIQPINAVPKRATPFANKLGFLYWKEVAYADRRKIISRTIDVFDHEMQMPFETLPNISQPFYQFFKYQPQSGPKPDYKLYRFELIFGKSDASYSSTNFTDFSFVFGLGAAPKEQMFSFLVKIIIFVCFCLPILVMLVGLGYLMLRRLRRSGDTELLLAAES